MNYECEDCTNLVKYRWMQCEGCRCEEWTEEFDQDEMSAEVEAENGYGDEE